MSRTPGPAPSDDPEPRNRLRRRWLTAADENGEPVSGWQADVEDEWFEKWPPCPAGSPLRLGHPLGFRERNVRELELRVLLGGDDGGVCQVIVDEQDDEVLVRVLVCRHDKRDGTRPAWRDYIDCPVRVWLQRPLGDRAVIDMDTDEELALYTARYLNGVVQPDHGYRPVRRRRSSSRRRTGPAGSRSISGLGGEASPEGLDRIRGLADGGHPNAR